MKTKGTKTIAVTLRFWTDDIDGEGGMQVGTCWEGGTARAPANPTHEIDGSNRWVPFNSFGPELLDAIKTALEEAGVTVQPSAHGNTKRSQHA